MWETKAGEGQEKERSEGKAREDGESREVLPGETNGKR